MTKEEQQTGRRFEDLARLSYQKQIPVFSDFLGLSEQNIFHSMERELSYASPVLFGGYPLAERQMLVFLPDALLFSSENPPEVLFPIRCLQITAADARFAEPFGHRDILGSVLNLGIDRSKTGDILTGASAGDGSWLFVHENLADFIIQNLTRIRHTSVRCTAADPDPSKLPKPALVRIEGSIASARIDAVLSMAMHVSRSSAKELTAQGKVFINGKLTTGADCTVSAGDLISVRGTGRFRYLGEEKATRKGRVFAAVERFV